MWTCDSTGALTLSSTHMHLHRPHPYLQRLLTQALMDANTYEEMEAEESRVLRKAAETEGDEDVEYGAQVSVSVRGVCVCVGWWGWRMW